MFTKTEERGGKKSRHNLFIATEHPDENEHGPCAVSYPIGSDSTTINITIRGNYPGNGVAFINGKESIKHVRDALIKICEMENIE